MSSPCMEVIHLILSGEIHSIQGPFEVPPTWVINTNLEPSGPPRQLYTIDCIKNTHIQHDVANNLLQQLFLYNEA